MYRISVHCSTVARMTACVLDSPYVSSWPLENYLLFLRFNWFASKIDIIVGFPGGSVVKNPHANAKDVGSIPESGRSPGGGHGNLLQHSCLQNPIVRGPLLTCPWSHKRIRHDSVTKTTLLNVIYQLWFCSYTIYFMLVYHHICNSHL